jgi:phage baseplate assembly protein W
MINKAKRNLTMAIYKGFSTVDNESNVFSAYDIELVKRDILNQLYTRKGERVMLPDFGSNLQDFVMDPFVDDIENDIKDEVISVVLNEPRVELIDVVVTTQEHLVNIEVQINYKPGDQADTLFLEFQRINESIT